MKRLSLNGAWLLDIPGSAFPRTEAAVPGSVYHDLLDAGLIPDPFYRDNEGEALKIMEYDFVYSRGFSVPAGFLACDAVLLRCHGLDTLAATTGEDAVTIEDVYEPYLMQLGFIMRTPRGRVCTPLAYEHLGKTAPANYSEKVQDAEQTSLLD